MQSETKTPLNADNSFGKAIGASLALSASLGILVAYWLGQGKSLRYWLTLIIFFLASTIVSFFAIKIKNKTSNL